MPVNSPSPDSRHGSRAKNSCRMRGKRTVDRTCHVCSGQRPRSTLPVTFETDPSAIRSRSLNFTSPPSIRNREVMSARIGR